MNTATDTLESNTPLTGGGYTVGQSATDLVGFYGATPIVKPTSASQAAVSAITNSAGGTSAYDTGMQALTSSYNSGILANSLITLSTNLNALNVEVTAIRAALVNLGLIVGS